MNSELSALFTVNEVPFDTPSRIKFGTVSVSDISNEKLFLLIYVLNSSISDDSGIAA
jgi:hypothetical protein